MEKKSKTSKIDSDFFEYVILFNCLTDETYMGTVVEYLKPDLFNSKDVQNIVEIIKDYFNKRSNVPTLTEVKTYLVTDELKNSFKRLVEQFKTLEKANNKQELLENTERFIKEKTVFNTMLEVTDMCTKAEVIDTNIVLDKFEHACSISLNNEKGHDYFVDIDKHCKDLVKVDNHIKTGWEWLDKKLGGGFLQDGRAIYVFAGETNVGKSIFLQNLAVNIANQNKSVIILTLEMSEMAYCKRISSNITQIPFNDLRNNVDSLKQTVTNKKLNLPSSRLLVKEFPPNTVTPAQITAFIKKLQQSGYKFDAIVIDYLNLLNAPKGDNSYERVKFTSEQVRAMSYVFKCPIITATQLNRSGYNQENPGLESISESIGTAATADVVIGLWQLDEDRELGVIKMSLLKNRYGPNYGTINMKINYPTLTLEEDNTLNADEEIVNTSEALKALSEEMT